MKKNQLMKWIMIPALAASVSLGGVTPMFSNANVAHAESTAQTQLNAFASHYAKSYKPLADRSESLMKKLDNDFKNQSEFDAFVEDYEVFIDDFDAFLEKNYTYGSGFNADLVDIEGYFYDALIAEFNTHIALYNYLIGEATEEEADAAYENEYENYTMLFGLFKTNVNSYKLKHNATFSADVYYLLNEEAPKEEAKPTATTHTVKKGETLYSLAKKYNMSVAELKSLNGLKKDVLSVGQVLKVKKDATPTPEKPTTPAGDAYTVKKGDTLNKIAKTYGMSVADLKKLNNLKNDTIHIGQVLKVKKAVSQTPSTPVVTPVKTTTKIVNVQTSLNVRSTASTNGKVLGSLKKNAKVEVVATTGDWSKIKYGNGFGYVHTKYLKDEAKKPTTTPSTPAPNAKTHTVKKGDTLYNISKTYKVSVGDLKKWNNLKTDSIKLGQKLKVSN